MRNSSNSKFVYDVAEKNVYLTIDKILKESDVLAQMQKDEEVKIIGAMYAVNTGAVTFYE